YGSPRIHAELVANGHGCSAHFVAKVMGEAGIAAKTKRKFRRPTDSNHTLPVAPNVRDRAFNPEEPHTPGAADVTSTPRREGWLYLAVLEDLFGPRVAGWSRDATVTSRLVVGPLEMALAGRLKGPSSSAPVAHSDRGPSTPARTTNVG
ncbi:MAG TPA: IS3 family transposase, partial [Gemmata sp.]